MLCSALVSPASPVATDLRCLFSVATVVDGLFVLYRFGNGACRGVGAEGAGDSEDVHEARSCSSGLGSSSSPSSIDAPPSSPAAP